LQVHPATLQGCWLWVRVLNNGSKKDVWSKKMFPLTILRTKIKRWVWWKVCLNNNIQFITLLPLLCPLPMMFNIRVINISFHNINNSINNSLNKRLFNNSIHKSRLQEQNFIQFPWSMQSCSQCCSKGIGSRLRLLHQYPRNCHHSLELTFHVSSMLLCFQECSSRFSWSQSSAFLRLNSDVQVNPLSDIGTYYCHVECLAEFGSLLMFLCTAYLFN